MRLRLAVVAFLISAAVHANEADRRLRELGPDQQQSMLTLFLHRSDMPCTRVNRVFRQGRTKQNRVIWNAACDNGRAYSIMFEPDANGSSRVMDCNLLRSLKAGECFKPL